MIDRSGVDVAIVGMGCVFPGAPDLAAFRENLLAGADSIETVPEGRWPEGTYDPDSDAVDRLYCDRGGFVDAFAAFDPIRWGLPPNSVEGTEPDQLLALEVAGRALEDAGLDEGALPRDRTGVILGRGGYVTPGQTRLVQAVRTTAELERTLRALIPDLDAVQIERARREYAERVPGLAADTMIGLVPNLTASRIANRLDLHGPAYTVDAACASALLAVDQACHEIASGRCDVALAGGVHLAQDVTFWTVFARMGAMSRSGTIRPFDRRADGLLIGEGVGVVALQRRADAEAAGRRIYAVIRGVGVSSDGRARSALVPHPEAQALALSRAWEAARLDPAGPGSIGLLEAHGTATPAGDRAEVETVGAVFGPHRDEGRRPVIGSVKSMIGHTMPAAGAAGLIKAALALHERQLPPTLHCEEPREDLAETRFRTIGAVEPWEPNGVPRRAGVNAFGFGGINAHVVLEESEVEPRPRGRRTRAGAGDEATAGRAAGASAATRRPALLAAAADSRALLADLEAGRADPGTGPCRLALLDPTPERIARALEVVREGRPFRDRGGTFAFAPGGLIARGGKIAFLFPGLDDLSDPDVDAIARLFGHDPPPAFAADGLVGAGLRTLRAGRFLAEILETELGLAPDAVAGHSLGEWSAALAAGVVPWSAAEPLLGSLDPDRLTIPDVAFAAVGRGVDAIGPVLEAHPDVAVSLDNCPRQVVLCGPDAELRAAVGEIRADGALCQVLDLRSGFHTPFLEPHLGPTNRILEALPFEPARVPYWSATTCAPFPDDPGALKRAFVEHLLRPVRFRETTLALHDAGFRAFVQVGQGRLTGFVGDTLDGLDHVAIPTGVARREDVEQLGRVVATLWAEGADVRWDRLLKPVGPGGAAGSADGPGRRKPRRPASSARPLALSTPLIAPVTPLSGLRAPDRGAIDEDDPVLAELVRTQRAVEDAHGEIVDALRRRRAEAAPNGTAPAATDAGPEPAPARDAVTVRRTLSLEACPYLLDHSFFSLPPGWPDPRDGFPTVPLTMSLSMMADAARSLALGRVVVAVEDVRASTWLSVADPVDVEIVAREVGDGAIRVAIGDYVEGTVRVGDAWPAAPEADPGPLPGERPVDLDPADMYARRLMFHGPRYQSVAAFHGVSDAGIRGTVERLEGEGSLLDGAGQVMGYWIRLHTEVDRLAAPILLDRVTFHGPEPEIGGRLECVVRIRHFGDWQVRADLDLHAGGRVWARIEGWVDRRMKSDAETWPAIQYPERHGLGRPHPALPEVTWLPPIESLSARDYFARRYLPHAEREAYEARAPRARADWAAGRIAAKDAVRRRLWAEGVEAVWPVEVSVGSDPSGRPFVRGPFDADLRISIAHKDGAAVAALAEGVDVGVDLETVAPRNASFDALAFGPGELALLPAGGPERDAWRARLWAAKEAAAKKAGTGLGGDPKRWPVESIDGEDVVVAGTRVATRRHGDWIVALTREAP